MLCNVEHSILPAPFMSFNSLDFSGYHVPRDRDHIFDSTIFIIFLIFYLANLLFIILYGKFLNYARLVGRGECRTLNENDTECKPKKEMPRPQNNSEEYLALLDSSQ